MLTTLQLGKYRIVAELGHGGMADVFLAIVQGPLGSGFAKLSVVKRLRSNLAEDPEFVAMLVDEARITARLNHPNVVQMLEVGLENDEYFLAMEYLDGQPFHRIERRASRAGAALTRDMQVAVLCDALAGLHHAHELSDYDGKPFGVVHRDVNPQNLFVTYDGQVKVVDFGIAKAVGRACETRQGIVKGKVRYMSPEQAMGRAVDRRADIFAVGILVWQVATEKKLWGELDELAIVRALIAGDYPTSPKSVNPETPEALDRVCRKALATNPDDRYATAEEMRVDLEASLSDRSQSIRRELGRLTSELFAKERKQLRAVVEEATRATDVVPSVPMLMRPASGSNASASNSSVPVTLPVTLASTSTVSMRVDSEPVAAQSGSSLRPSAIVVEPKRPRHLYAASIAAALGACVAVMSVFAFPTDGGSRVRSPAARVADIQPLESTLSSRRIVITAAAEAPVVMMAPASAPIQASVARIESAPPPNFAPAVAASTTAASSMHGAPPKHSRARLSIDATDPWSARGN